MTGNHNIACVIVTYNRKLLLKKCLDAVVSQVYKPVCVYIVDNASTDGTMDSVKEWGYFECEKERISFKYILNSKNEGGAGGFYLGMKTAYEKDLYDAIWVMDDDGEPDSNCLKELVAYLGRYDYIAPIVLSNENHYSCSFFPDENYDTIKNKLDATGGIIHNWASPFNGILFSTQLISKIGYPKKEMFIWGDEQNYHMRAKKCGVLPITVLNAIHYHPIDRQEYKCGFNNRFLRIAKSKWQLYCLCRNTTYNERIQKGWIRTFIWLWYDMMNYLYYYNVKLKDHSNNFLFLDAYLCGYLGIFSRLSKYKKE